MNVIRSKLIFTRWLDTFISKCDYPEISNTSANPTMTGRTAKINWGGEGGTNGRGREGEG